MQKPIMTLSECARELRRLGVRTSNQRICDGLEKGVYPFGAIFSVGPSGRRTTVIYWVKFNAWVKENLGVEL